MTLSELILLDLPINPVFDGLLAEHKELLLFPWIYLRNTTIISVHLLDLYRSRAGDSEKSFGERLLTFLARLEVRRVSAYFPLPSSHHLFHLALITSFINSEEYQS